MTPDARVTGGKWSLILLAFASAGLPLAGLNTAVSIYLPRHFAMEIGISLAAVGAAFGVVRLIDVGVDVALGFLMDRTRTPWGRYRVWAGAAGPILMLAVYMLFMSPPGVGVGYLIVWLLVMYLGTSMLGLAHAAWASTLAPTYRARSRLFGLVGAVGVLGSVLVLLVPVITSAAGVASSQPMVLMGCMLVVLFPLTTALMVAVTPEQALPSRGAFRVKDIWMVVARPTTIRILLADLCLALSPGWFSASYLFFFTDARGFAPVQVSAMLVGAILAGALGAPFWAGLANRISKHRAVMVSAVSYSAALAAMWLTPKGNLLIAYPVLFAAGFVLSGFNVLTRAMIADVSDELRLEQDKVHTGLLYALATMTSKIGSAIAISLTFTALAYIGYKPGLPNSEATLLGLQVVSIAGPILFALLGAACLFGYRLDEARHADILRQLELRDRARAVTS